MSKPASRCVASGSDLPSESFEPDGNMVPNALRFVALPRATMSFVQHLAAMILIAGGITPTNAYDITTCCMTRAREILDQLNTDPFTACSAGILNPWDINPAPPSVMADMAWCLQNCPGIAPSGLDDWLHPLAQWFAPYTALLFLCPTGEVSPNQGQSIFAKAWDTILYYTYKKLKKCLGQEEKKSGEEKKFARRNFSRRVLEWINILGDPSSAIWGGTAQLGMDTWIVRRMCGKKSVDWYERNMYGVVIMASQTPMNDHTGERLTKELIIKGLTTATNVAIHHMRLSKPSSTPWPPSSIIALKKSLHRTNGKTYALDKISRLDMRLLAENIKQLMASKLDLSELLENMARILSGLTSLTDDVDNKSTAEELKAAIDHVVRDVKNQKRTLSPVPDPPDPLPHEDSTFDTSLRKAIRTILEARLKFMTAIALPVVVHFATTAQVFYESYQKLGDNSTAHSLAYGASYSWLLLVVVIGNCAVASANAGLIKHEIKEIFTLSGVRVPLRKRYANSLEWECWLTDIGIETELKDRLKDSVPTDEASKYAFKSRFYIKYFMGQFVGWACVAFFCACAATISYTTPTVGLGCRTFNLILYGILSLVTALLQVLRHKMERAGDQEAAYQSAKTDPEKAQGTNRDKASKPPRRWRHVRNLYIFFVSVNAFVLVGGTLFNFAGLYTACRCKNLFGPSDYQVELAPYTLRDQNSANEFWNSTGFVAYLFAWCICAVAVVVRKYLHGRLDAELPEHNEDDEATKALRKKWEDADLKKSNRPRTGEEDNPDESGHPPEKETRHAKNSGDGPKKPPGEGSGNWKAAKALGPSIFSVFKKDIPGTASNASD